MIHYIENSYIKIGVKEFGCELTSIINKENGTEYLWQGDASYWTGQSPILFPIVGRLIEDSYFLDGKKYTMPKHGFARKMQWSFGGADESSMFFTLSQTEETLAMYPYNFTVKVTFTLDKNSFRVTHEIINENDGVMYASLGAHPAFNCHIGDRLVFSENETLDTVRIDLVNSLRLPETVPVLKSERVITVTKDIFNEDALIFSGVKSDTVTLESDNHSRKVIFHLNNSPWLGIWAKPGAPYVCIEPWCGVNDSMEKKDDFSQKEGINAIRAGESFVYSWTAEII